MHRSLMPLLFSKAVYKVLFRECHQQLRHVLLNLVHDISVVILALVETPEITELDRVLLVVFYGFKNYFLFNNNHFVCKHLYVLDVTLNYIRWRGSITGALGSGESHFRCHYSQGKSNRSGSTC